MLERFRKASTQVEERGPPRRGVGRVPVVCRWRGGSARIEVEFYRPARVVPHNPLLFILHGWQRDADRYRDAWIPFAEREGRILVAPCFTKADFPGNRGFNQGDVLDGEGMPRPQDSWALRRLEDLFDALSRWFEHPLSDYDLYGHSAGAQFVHRLALLLPEARARRVIAANAGWYTLPELRVPYPYGLRGPPVDETGLRRAFERDLVVLLGGEDTDCDDPSLQRLPRGLEQGANRLERGLYFHRRAREAADALGAAFRWRLVRAPGIGHDHVAMVPAAAACLTPEVDDHSVAQPARRSYPGARRSSSGAGGA